MFKYLIQIPLLFSICFTMVMNASFASTKNINALTELAEKGNANALNELGTIYAQGLEGTKKDLKKGFDYLLKAAELNHPEAQFHVALFYDAGFLGKIDTQKAAHYYQKSADNNFTPAFYSLGHMLIQGEGVPKDIDKGLIYWQKSSNAGEVTAQDSLGKYYLGIKDFEKAKYYLDLAVDNGSAESMFNLGIMYSKGLGVKTDQHAAYIYFSHACEKLITPECTAFNQKKQ